MKIALNMIMKNEEKVLPRVLKSVISIIDTYYILDTGSTDKSIKIVKEFFDLHGISGEIHVNTDCVEVIEGKTCFIYDKARNEALKLLKGKADYGFFIDCDEELIVSPHFNIESFKNELSKFDSGSLTMISSVNYGRMAFFKVNKPFRWVGMVHEVLVCDEPISKVNINGLSVIVHKDEDDNNTEKYKTHTLVLQKQVDEYNSPRDVFYLANSYRDCGEWEKAVKYYRKRVEMLDGFYEERYYSQFMIGNLYWGNGKPYQETLIEFFKCSELDTLRCEHLFNAIIILQNNNLWQTAYMISKSCVERFYQKSPYPNRVLFLHEDVYSHRIMDLHNINLKVLGIEKDNNDKINKNYDFYKRNEVDVVIISYAKTNELYNITLKGIESLFQSEENIKFNVFVIESNIVYNYDNLHPNIKTIYPKIPFNYNAYLNIGIEHGKSDYVMLCNNDLIYEKGFASKIIHCMDKDKELLSTSPFCPQLHSEDIKSKELHFGYNIREHICGWCIFVKRDLFKIIGEINTNVEFWYSDNIFAEQLILNKIKHGLVTKSVVNHHEYDLGVSGTEIFNNHEKKIMTTGQYHKFIEAKNILQKQCKI